MSAATAAGLVLLDIDPNIVRPGWTPLVILVALLGAVALLYVSLRKQLGKINLPDDPTYADDQPEPGASGGTEGDGPAAPSAGTGPGASSPRSG
jgi:hypothetical protein